MITVSECEIAADGKPFKLVTLQNSNGMQIRLTDWGATWLSCQVPIQQQLREVVLGCSTVALHVVQGAYLGASVGRFANRIANAEFSLHGNHYKLDANQQGKHQLHGGSVGFAQQRWTISDQQAHSVQFSLFSGDGDQGFPGNLETKVRFSLREDNAVVVEYSALSDQDTPLNLTNHAYFNLDGESAEQTALQHRLKINAAYYLPVDAEGIPKEPLKPVANSGFDFRQSKPIAQDFLHDADQKIVAGYDHAFLLDCPSLGEQPQIELSASNGDLTLQIFTDQAAVQVYSGNFLADTPNRTGGVYVNHAGIALETQALPDTPNHPEWFKYGGISNAGERYHKTTVFCFKAN
ncbi:galactose-1-epimerase [Testudinibacter sp. TR-2022]|uniref:galactose-1-epimerase n=2 Tax=Testudinibacter sp. TR-2022 TaxID=2585029 RepID=UPI001119341C|nr:galactose-1-epimerase [Testudinibacter sp. TR-2022]TNH05620.1 galactose-1-epimerase [Pasteurellaceae bacterium Phil31]TNH10584.1 galactose-1-epimerase [Testudinibacter sp. TR-2022]TNH14055.1 galactose-1-epimerase [Testudinibacter sp. TR-2022]TNH19287.1 galactose-1-epimerase [Testudinibacter sp. TR-2022]